MAESITNKYDDFTNEAAYPLSIKKLLNEVVAKIPDQWEKVGLLLKISQSKIDSIKTDVHNDGQPKNYFKSVLLEWEKSKQVPYNWSTLLKIIAGDVVGNPSLANEIAERLRRSDRKLTAGNAFQLLKACDFRIVSNWSKLGASLRVSIEDRKRLRTQAMLHSNYDDCLEECLDIWIKNEEHKASWEELFTAVEREEKVTAKRMRDKYKEWK